jgi:subtilisin family serine protease
MNKLKPLIPFALISILQSCGNVSDTPTKSTNYWNDPLFSYSWSLKNIGQKIFSYNGGVSGEDINVSKAHSVEKLTGKGIKIVISDTGIQENHPDLEENLLKEERKNYKNNKISNSYLKPSQPHGTMVSGIIGALGNNGIGSVGIAPEATMIDYNWLDPNLKVTDLEKQTIKNDQYSGDYDIFNFSWGIPICFPFVKEDDQNIKKLRYQATKGRGRKGVIFVQSSGNGFGTKCKNDLFVIANSVAKGSLNTNYKIVVGSYNASGVKSSYSTPGPNLWISAPGGEYGKNSPAIVAPIIMDYFKSYGPIDLGFRKGPDWNGMTDRMNGTSAAAPMVSGSIALILESNPNLTLKDVKYIIAKTARKIDPSSSGWKRNAAGFNFNNYYGFGSIDVDTAIKLAKTYRPNRFGKTIETNNFFEKSKAQNLNEIRGEKEISNIKIKNDKRIEIKLNVSSNLETESVQIMISLKGKINELGLELVSPSGTTSKIFNKNSNIKGDGLDDFVFLSNAFFGEASRGDWKLRITKSGNNDMELIGWAININGHEVK